MSAPRSHAPRHTAPRYVPSGRRRRFMSEQIRLVILLSLSACILLALQTTILSRFPLPFSWSAPAAPSLALLLVLAVGFQLGEQEGSVCGLAVGWLCDAVGSRDVMLLPLEEKIRMDRAEIRDEIGQFLGKALLRHNGNSQSVG